MRNRRSRLVARASLIVVNICWVLGESACNLALVNALPPLPNRASGWGVSSNGFSGKNIKEGTRKRGIIRISKEER